MKLNKCLRRKTKNITVFVALPLTKKKGRGYFSISSGNAQMKFGLREARTVYSTLRDFFIPPEKRGKLF